MSDHCGFLSGLGAAANTLGVTESKLHTTLAQALSFDRLVDYFAEIVAEPVSVVRPRLRQVFEPSADGLRRLVRSLELAVPESRLNDLDSASLRAVSPSEFVTALSTELRETTEATALRLIETSLSDLGFRFVLFESPPCEGGLLTEVSATAGRRFASPADYLGMLGQVQFIGVTCPTVMRRIPVPRAQLLDRWLTHTFQRVADESSPLFKGGIRQYRDEFLDKEGRLIAQYIARCFHLPSDVAAQVEPARVFSLARERIRYVITCGIGANEMRWHSLAYINNHDSARSCKWVIVDSAKQIDEIPTGANASNTIRLTFTRSGETEETNVSEEVLYRRFPHSIVFCNRGELCELARAHEALVIPMPRHLAGRYSGFKSPVNIAPMYILGMDTSTYWNAADRVDKLCDFSKADTLAHAIAEFLFRAKTLFGSELVYLAHNDELIAMALQELHQLVMEGVAKEGNRLFSLISTGFPRSSHYETEGLLGNPSSAIYWSFVNAAILRDPSTRYKYARDARKRKLFGDHINAALLSANLNTFAETSPAIVTLLDSYDLETAASLSKLWEDVTYLLCRLCSVDPFGNPQVKQVREQSGRNVDRIYDLLASGVPDRSIFYDLIKQHYQLV